MIDLVTQKPIIHLAIKNLKPQIQIQRQRQTLFCNAAGSTRQFKAKFRRIVAESSRFNDSIIPFAAMSLQRLCV